MSRGRIHVVCLSYYWTELEKLGRPTFTWARTTFDKNLRFLFSVVYLHPDHIKHIILAEKSHITHIQSANPLSFYNIVDKDLQIVVAVCLFEPFFELD